MIADVTTGRAQAEGGAELYFERRGSGPALLMISGGGGDCGGYVGVGEQLADTYEVISYDRRACSRSTGSRDHDMAVAQQTRDAVAVLDAVGVESAMVFGNSGGAIIGLDLAARFPERVERLVAHEPPVIRMLPDAEEWIAFFDEVVALNDSDGPEAATAKFFESVSGLTESHTGRGAEVFERLQRNLHFFYKREMKAFVSFVPDTDAIRAAGMPVVMSVGRESEGYYYARTVPIVAEQLGCPVMEFPGHHTGATDVPEEFAAALREALRTP
jgi:pimeloyl-ACP methyl ester carboxylesterase